MSKYFYKGVDINYILGDYNAGDNSPNLPGNVNNIYNGLLRSTTTPPTGYIESAISNLNGGSHLNLGYKINGIDIYSYGVAPNYFYNGYVTAPSWANHFSALTVGGGGGGGGGGGKVGNDNGYDGGGGGGAAFNYYRLYALNGQRTLNAVVGGGGGGGQIGGTDGGAGGNSYINIDGVNIVIAGGGGGGKRGNANPGEYDDNGNYGGYGGTATNHPSDITLMSVDSGKYNPVTGSGGAPGARDGHRNNAAGGGGHGIYGGTGGYGGSGSNDANKFKDGGYGDGGQGGSVRIWWFGGYR